MNTFLRITGVLLLFGTLHPLSAQNTKLPEVDLIKRSLTNESADRQSSEHFTYTSQERSTRTGQHLWTEKVVEFEEGSVRRLILIDGQPLSKDKAREEEERIARLVSHPEAFHQANRERDADEKSREKMMTAMASAFIFTYDGEAENCTRIRFKPNPSFVPSSYQEGVLHVLEGTILIKEPEDRVCGLDATTSEPVAIGFGVVGRIEQGGHIHVRRTQISAGTWRTSNFDIHLVGRMLVVKSISQQHDETRTDIREIPAHLSLAQAVALIAP